MLEIRPAHAAAVAMHPSEHGGLITGLREDADYVITWPGHSPGSRLFIDDVELASSADGSFRWRPGFYAGRALAELHGSNGSRDRVWLDVGPSASKSGDECFAEMVGEIRAFDPALLTGVSAATMTFGRDGRQGLFTDDILLARLREHGPGFVDAVKKICSRPHRSMSANLLMLPLSRVRRLHPEALRDRRVAALCSGHGDPEVDSDAILLRSLTSAPTFDTPANRALVALLRRVLAAVLRMSVTVAALGLGADAEQQSPRMARRLEDLEELETRIRTLLGGSPFCEIRQAETTAAGLTQIAAQPEYNRAYRLGCMALATSVEGDSDSSGDALHVNHAWGIYETWCYLAVLGVVGQLLGRQALGVQPADVSAQLAHRFELADGTTVDAYFQALFPSEAPSAGRVGWSISRERRPDILLIVRRNGRRKALVLDAKWRSGRGNVLEAMESAHIYHDALRLDGEVPNPCLLLLPGPADVPGLGADSYIADHSVGAISEFRVSGAGVVALAQRLSIYLGE